MSARLSAEEELELVMRARAGDRAAEAQLLVDHLAPAYAMANIYFRKRWVPMEDLQQEATFGLLTAIRRFDPSRGVRFVTYAMWWVRTCVQRASRRWYHLSQEPPDHGGRWLNTFPQPEPPAPPFEIDLEMLEKLPSSQRAAVELVLGLNGESPHSRTQLAKALGVRLITAKKLYVRGIRQLRSMAIARRRAALRRRAA